MIIIGDTLICNAGANTLNGTVVTMFLMALQVMIYFGGAGKDTMTGGLGSDGFVFNAIGDSGLGVNSDIITDFVHGTDKINLAAIDANVFVDGNQAFTQISSTAAFTAAGQIKFNAGILSGDVTGDGTADFQIALTGVITLTAIDLVL